MISGDLKAHDSIPRASLPFSWNTDGDSGSRPVGPTTGAAFLQHLDTAQSVHSRAIGSAPKAKDPTSHDRESPSDAPSSSISVPPAVQQSARPLVKPNRKVAAPPRTLIQAKARLVGPSADLAPTSHGVGMTPSAIAAQLSCDSPQAHSTRLDLELPNRPLPTSTVDTRTEWAHGFAQRPLMDSSSRPTESKIAWSKEGSPESYPSSGSLRPANDTRIRQSPDVLPTASKAFASRSGGASPSNLLSEGRAPIVSVLDEKPPKRSMEAHGGASTSEKLAKPTNDSTTVVATLNRANRAPQVAGAVGSLQSNTASSSATPLDPSDLKHSISSEVRDAARRAVAQSQILDFPTISEPPVRHTNKDALRSLVLDPNSGAGSKSNSEWGPALDEHLGETKGVPFSESFLALGQISEGQAPFASVHDQDPSNPLMEAPGGASTPATVVHSATDSSVVEAALNQANRVQLVVGAMEPLQSNRSSNSATASDPLDLKHSISIEVRDTARRDMALSQKQEVPSISGPTARNVESDLLHRIVLDPSAGSLADSNSELLPALDERLGETDGKPNSESPQAVELISVSPKPVTASLTSEAVVAAASVFNRRAHVTSGNPDPDLDPFGQKILTPHPTPLRAIESPATGASDLPLDSAPSEVLQHFVDSGKSSVSAAATESGFPSMKRIESSWQNGEFIPRENNSISPDSESLANTSTSEDLEPSSSIDSNLTVTQSQPQPSGPSFRSAMRSPLPRNSHAGESEDTAKVSLDSEKGFPEPLELKQGTEGSIASESLTQDAGSDSPSPLGPDSSPGVVPPTAVPFPGAPQSGPIQERLSGRIATPSKPEESTPSAPAFHETQKLGAVRRVQLDSPGSGSVELRIQEVGEKLIIRTQDLVGSLEGQSAQWKELQQRLESNGIVLMPIEHSVSGIATPIESQSISANSRHTVCYDGGMGTSGRDSSDPRSSSGRARAPHQSAHQAPSESADESMKSGETLPASRQWWA